MPVIREDGLQLEEHRGFQRAFWLVQRCAWVLFGLILLMALSGLTGAGGHLGRGNLTFRNGELDFPRVARWAASDEIRVRFDAGGDAHSLSFGSVFYDYFEVEAVQPEPQQMLASVEGTTMQFRTRPHSPAHVVVYVRPLRPGFPRYPVQLDAAAAEVRGVVLP